jgi:short-subunit dehydrogenase
MLSDYVASKSALSSLHHTLTNEIRTHPSPLVRSNLKTILVETGQLNTSLFQSVKVPGWTRFIAPLVDVNELAREILYLVGQGESGVLRRPAYAAVVGRFWTLVPGAVERAVRWAVGVDRSFG